MNKDNIKENRKKKIAIMYLLSFVLFEKIISVTERVRLHSSQ